MNCKKYLYMKKLFIYLLFLLPHLAHSQDFMMQAWYWDYPKLPTGGNWVNTLNGQASGLNGKFTYMWLPPLAKGSSGNNSNGYDPRDLYDYGQYTGGCAWGNRSGLDGLINTYNSNNIKAVGDLVYNHRDGGRPENNPGVENWIKNYSTSQGSVFPSDRFRCILPMGGSSQNGAGDYYIKIKSKSGSSNFYNKAYKLYIETSKTKWSGQAGVNEIEPNGGGGCNQPSNAMILGKDVFCTVDAGGCGADEFKLTVAAGQINATDTLFIYFTNPNGDYSDHYISNVWSVTRNTDIVNDVRYQTYTDFSNMPSGQGSMNYLQFKPNGVNGTSLSGDWDWLWFYYDYEHNNSGLQNALIDWTKWNWSNVGIRGLRIDAVKHFPPAFFGQLMNSLNASGQNPGMVCGEFFDYNPSALKSWVDQVRGNMSSSANNSIKVRAFDFSMRNALKTACDGFSYDVRNLYTSGIVEGAGGSGDMAVTFINNHDFRDAGQPVQNDPKLAYAYIMTNNRIGVPCVYYPDYYGVSVPNAPTVNLQSQIDQMISIHKQHIFGSTQLEYLNKEGSFYLNGSNYISGGSGASKSTTAIYQMKGGASGRDVIVAINFSGSTLKVDHAINTSGNPQGTKFDDAMGNSTFASSTVDGSGRIYIELPPRSYSVWVRQSGQAAVLSVAATNVKNVTCGGGNDGSVTVSATGISGCTPNYAWSNGQSGATLNNLIAGIYTCTATCGGTAGNYTVTITQPANITVATASNQAITCATAGAASITATGGTAGYTYLWQNNATTAAIAPTTGGNYTVTVTDSKQCKKTHTISVTENTTPPTVQIQNSSIISCTNASVTLSNSTTQAGYTYQWTGPNIITGTNPTLVTTEPGNYKLTVTNATNGCKGNATFDLIANSAPPTITSIAPVTVTCATPAPKLNVVATSAINTVLTYAWSNNATGNNIPVTSGGTYTVTVTDTGNNCKKTASVTVAEDKTEPTAVVATAPTITCTVSTVQLNGAGSSTGANYTYAWGATNGNIVSGATTLTPTVNKADTYTISVTNSVNGCVKTANVNVTEDGSIPTASVQGLDVLCPGGSTTLTATSGFNTYLWSTGATTPTISANAGSTNSVTVTAANGCTKVVTKNVATAPLPVVTIGSDTLSCAKTSLKLIVSTASSLTSTVWSGPSAFSSNVLAPNVFSAGTYTLVATNTNGCTAQFTTNIYSDKSAPTVAITGTTNICSGSTTTLTATPGLGTYLWNTGGNNNALTVGQTGNYSVTVTNSKGCKGIAISSVTVDPIPNVVASADVKACEAQDIIINSTVTNTKNVTFAWQNISNSFTASTAKITLTNVTANASGNYIVTAISPNSCKGKDTVVVSIASKTNIDVTALVNCNTYISNLNAVVTGGKPNYTYKWSNNPGNNLPTTSLSFPKNVGLTVTDSYGCVNTFSKSYLDQVFITPTIGDIKNGVGSISLEVVGNEPLLYAWSNGSTTKNISITKSGSYCVTVTDGFGCKTTECYTVATTKTNETLLDKSISIFPNPVQEVLTLDIKGNLQINQINLFDDKGSLIQSYPSTTRQINTSTLPNAVYFLKIVAEEGFTVKNFVKM